MSETRPLTSLKIRRLSYRYPRARRLALDAVDFDVPPGCRLGLLGPNGAGKSTLMRIVSGFLPLHADRSDQAPCVEVGGMSVVDRPDDVRAQVGYLPEHVPLYPELRVREHLGFRASIKGVPWRRRNAEIDRVCELTGLLPQRTTPVAQLSRGYRQRVGIADALLGAPPLLILDEPTVGLDPNQVLEIRAMLRELGGSQTLVFSSHILAEVEALCDRVVILSEGRVVVDETLGKALSSGHIDARWQGTLEQVRGVLARLDPDLACDGDSLVSDEADRVGARIDVPEGVDPQRLLEALGRTSCEQGVPIVHLALGKTRLEERFAEVTGAARAASIPASTLELDQTQEEHGA